MNALIKRAAHAAAATTGLSTLLARRQRRARVLMYHGIHPGVLDPREFEAQLRYLRRHFEPVGLPELVHRLRENTLGGREVVLTFDDGVQNHAHVVAPLLARHEVPATFFVCPDLSASGRWIWNFEMRCRLSRLSPAARLRLAADVGSPANGIGGLIGWAKTLALTARRDIEAAVCRATPQFQPTPEEQQLYAPLDWTQLRQLDWRWVTVGGHSCNHPILPTLDAVTLEDEVARCRRDLEAGLHREVPWFCYPNGDADENVVRCVARHYTAAVSTRQGLLDAAEDLHRIRRIPAGESHPLFQWRLHRPSA